MRKVATYYVGIVQALWLIPAIVEVSWWFVLGTWGIMELARRFEDAATRPSDRTDQCLIFLALVLFTFASRWSPLLSNMLLDSASGT